MISEIKYLVKKANKKTIVSLVALGVVVGGFPIAATNASNTRSFQGNYVDGSGNRQSMNLVTPGGKNRPGIIFVHGGGWRSGDKNQYDGLQREAAKRGYASASINYRLGSGGIYYQYEDVMRAVLTIRANAQQYGVDPNRIAIWGDSAGGSLAMRVAASGDSGLAAAVGWSAPVNAYTGIFDSAAGFAISADHSTCMDKTPPEVKRAFDAYYHGQVGVTPTGEKTARSTASYYNPKTPYALESAKQVAATAPYAATASPSTAKNQIPPYVQRWILGNLDQRGCRANLDALSPAVSPSKRTPATILISAQSEDLVHPQQSLEYSAKLRSMGISSKAVILPGANHMGYDQRAVAPSFTFLDQQLKR
mgnify:CR=1 FL=1